MSIVDKLLERSVDDKARSFELSLVVPGVGSVLVAGDVLPADSREYKRQAVNVKRMWAEDKIKADDYPAELISRITSNVTVDGEPITNETLRQLIDRYESLLDAIDRESTANTVFTVKPQTSLLNTQSGKRGSTNQQAKAPK